MASPNQVRRAMDQMGAELERKRHVVGMGAVPARDGRRGHYDLAVYVDTKESLGELAAEDVVPEQVKIPGRDGEITIGVQVIEQGRVEPELQAFSVGGVEVDRDAESEASRPGEFQPGGVEDDTFGTQEG